MSFPHQHDFSTVQLLNMIDLVLDYFLYFDWGTLDNLESSQYDDLQ